MHLAAQVENHVVLGEGHGLPRDSGTERWAHAPTVLAADDADRAGMEVMRGGAAAAAGRGEGAGWQGACNACITQNTHSPHFSVHHSLGTGLHLVREAISDAFLLPLPGRLTWPAEALDFRGAGWACHPSAPLKALPEGRLLSSTT